MSERWPGGIVRSTPVTPTGPLQNGTAPGVWSLADAAYWTKQGLWPTAGNFLAVEDVFSTWLYTGNASTQTITNGINLSGSGGLVWTKSRDAAFRHYLFDTVRGMDKDLSTNNTDAQGSGGLASATSTGFSFSGATNGNQSGTTFGSWTFREAPNFFDVVTYTGNGALTRDIAHNLGSRPHCVIIKRTDTTENWKVGFRDAALNFYALQLNTTDAANTGTTYTGGYGYGIASGANVNTHFRVEEYGGSVSAVNASGGTYVAYLYAHDATSDGIIQCGSFTTDGSGAATVTLGWEPQWLMAKSASLGGPWVMTDIMRGMTASGVDATLLANSSAAEGTSTIYAPTATGFTATNLNGSTTYIYIAIRRGPMRTPTLGTSVFAPTLATFSGSTVTNTGFVVDMAINKTGVATGNNNFLFDRLRGSGNSSNQQTLVTNASDADVASSGRTALTATNVSIQNGFLQQDTTANNIVWAFRRAPGFFDEVCYTGTGSAGTITHNLGVVPELVITKGRGNVTNWGVYTAALGPTKALLLNTTSAEITSANYWNNTAPTATQVSLGVTTNSSTTFVAYLFASAPGVSKVGSYTGNGSSQTINCAFTTGARFVLIKRTDSTGGWLVWDSARGIVAGNDPYLALNSTAAEVTTDDSVDTDNTGFIVNQVAASNVNVNAATYIFLAIA